MSVIEVEQLKKAIESTDGSSALLLQEEHYVDIAGKRAYIQTQTDNNKARRDYSEKLFWLTCSWLAIVLAVVVLSGFKILELSDAVLITLITTTTANVLGFFVLVIRYLFNPDKST